jgi:hypothetical protein
MKCQENGWSITVECSGQKRGAGEDKQWSCGLFKLRKSGPSFRDGATPLIRIMIITWDER